MTDPYLPALDAFAFEQDETEVIDLALASDKPWEFAPADAAGAEALKRAKDKILAFHLQRHGWTCCYCRTNLHGAGPFMTDREHVLPKSKPAYRALSYAPWNLAAACKRCNMQFKKNTDRFVVECDDPSALMDSASYRFVHPNFDRWENHLTRLGFQIGTNNLIKFFKKQGSDKAPYAYDFFDLRALEVDSFDAAQGLDNRPEMTAAVAAFHQLAASYGQ